MLNTIYRLVEPRKFGTAFTDIDMKGDKVVVRPTHLSICNADQRYFQGKRDPEVLSRKLPMALIHEGIGVVVHDPEGVWEKGTPVVMVPNTPVEEDEIIAENYLRSSRFRASGFDGFMQDYVVLNRDRVVELPASINREVASFTEFTSVCYHTINRFRAVAHSRREAIGIWGDGNLAYVVALFLKLREPQARLYVFGKHNDKLEKFTFVDGIYHINDVPEDISFDHAFECVGNMGSPKAINQIIDLIRPEGTIAIMGVTEDLAPINTRMVLEKGLYIFGSSRSGSRDFADTIKFYVENPTVVEYLEHIVGEVIEVNEMDDFTRAFEADIRKADGKTIMKWNI
ncbi:MAG: zinc-binding dehydrogenase [Clostridiales bacterium]|nr:zinc-binding dehydrogenase [Candidatus Crickella caballi]